MKPPRGTQPFPTSVQEGATKTPGADLSRLNEVVSATGRALDWQPAVRPLRPQPPARFNNFYATTRRDLHRLRPWWLIAARIAESAATR